MNGLRAGERRACAAGAKAAGIEVLGERPCPILFKARLLCLRHPLEPQPSLLSPPCSFLPLANPSFGLCLLLSRPFQSEVPGIAL